MCVHLEEVLVGPQGVSILGHPVEAVQGVGLARELWPKGHLVDHVAHVDQLGQHMARQHLQAQAAMGKAKVGLAFSEAYDGLSHVDHLQGSTWPVNTCMHRQQSAGNL
jgi:hypothetical protein